MRLNDRQRNLPYSNQLYPKGRLAFFAPDRFPAKDEVRINRLSPRAAPAESAGFPTGYSSVIRITVSIDSDEPLEAIICDGPVDCTHLVRTVIFDLGNEYKYRQVRSGSIFAGSSAIETGPPDVVDDSENIRGQLREQLARVRQDELAGTVKLTFVRPEVWPGDVVRQISGRGVDLRQWGGPGEALPQVDKVRITLADQWTTTIRFGS